MVDNEDSGTLTARCPNFLPGKCRRGILTGLLSASIAACHRARTPIPGETQNRCDKWRSWMCATSPNKISDTARSGPKPCNIFSAITAENGFRKSRTRRPPAKIGATALKSHKQRSRFWPIRLLPVHIEALVRSRASSLRCPPQHGDRQSAGIHGLPFHRG